MGRRMQKCWSTVEYHLNVEESSKSFSSSTCEFCFEPSSPVARNNTISVSHPRQFSINIDAVDIVPLSSSTPESHRESYSSECESPFGNELSSTKNSWISGMNELLTNSLQRDDNVVDDDVQSKCNDDLSAAGAGQENTEDDSFEVLSFKEPPEHTLHITEFSHTTLANQDNRCECCHKLFTSLPNSSARRCHYYGKLYCVNCHVMDYEYIPSKVIQSLDSRLYPVCRRAKSVIQSNLNKPIVDIQSDNESLYKSVSLLSKIRETRVLYRHIHAYLSTCSRIKNELNDKYLKYFISREYLYESVHLYSLKDLLSLKKIAKILRTASKQAKEHILTCELCLGRGFNCEICKNSKEILFPFYDMKTIGQCDRCTNTYHRRCWEKIDRDCPKCYRLIQRGQL